MTRKNFSNRNRRTLGVQSLESRGMLAGDVAISIGAGNVTLTGDGSDNEISIISQGAGIYELSGDNGTTINGGPGPIQFEVGVDLIFNLTLNMKGGNDIVTIDGAGGDTLPGVLSVGGGDGDNTINVQNGLAIGGKLAIVNGVGNDTVLIDDVSAASISITNAKGGSHVTIEGGTSVTGDITVNALADEANGNDVAFDDVSAKTVNVAYGVTDGASSMSFDNMNVTTNLTLRNSGGTVVANLGGTANTIGGKLTVDFGNGDHNIDLNDIDVGGDISIRTKDGVKTIDIGTTGAVVVNGHLTMNNGGGSDTINIVDADVGAGAAKGNISITNDGGDSDVEITEGSVDGNIAVVTRSGNSTVELGTMAALTVTGNVSIRNGNGDSTTNIDNLATRDISISNGQGDNAVTLGAIGANDVQTGSVTIRNGNGDATVTVNDTTIFRDLVINNGNSNVTNTVNVGTAVAVSVGRNLTITDGNGDAAITLNEVAVTKALSIRGTAGLETVVIDSLFDVNGGANIDTGADDDTVDIMAGADFTVGKVTIILGQGDDDLTIGAIASFNTTTPNFLFDGGLGGLDDLVTDVALNATQLKKVKNFESISP